MLYSCTDIATVGVKGLKAASDFAVISRCQITDMECSMCDMSLYHSAVCISSLVHSVTIHCVTLGTSAAINYCNTGPASFHSLHFIVLMTCCAHTVSESQI